MSTESNTSTDYYSVSSGSKRRKLSNDLNGSKSALTGVSTESVPKVFSSASEDPEAPSTAATTTSGEGLNGSGEKSEVSEENVGVSGEIGVHVTEEPNEQAEKTLPLSSPEANSESKAGTTKLGAESELQPKSKTEPEPETKIEAKTDSKSESTQPASSRPVFGAASAFGSASLFEKMKNRVNVFDTPAAKESGGEKSTDNGAENNGSSLATSQSTTSAPAESQTSVASSFGSFGGSFGANSVFSNALQKASQKKSFLDEPEAEPKSSESSSAPATQEYKQVDLKETVVSTGEENEVSVFNANTKLFELQFSKLSEGWKERGVGPLHLNKALSGKAQARIVMRSKGLLRVILNYGISPNTEFLKGLEASLSPGKFLRMNAISDGEPVQYLLKFANEELRNELFEKVEQLKEELKAKSDSKGEESTAEESKEKGETKSKEKKAFTEKPKPETGFRFIDTETSPARTHADPHDNKSHA